MIGLAFKTDAVFLESVVGSKQATEHNDHRTQMRLWAPTKPMIPLVA